MAEESVAHALERWRQAERDEQVALDDEATAGELHDSQEHVIEAQADYELAADRARKRQAPAEAASSVAKLDHYGQEPRP